MSRAPTSICGACLRNPLSSYKAEEQAGLRRWSALARMQWDGVSQYDRSTKTAEWACRTLAARAIGKMGQGGCASSSGQPY